MGLQQQLEAALGQSIPVLYESELLEILGGTRRDALVRLERNGCAVDMLAVLRGEVKPHGPVCFVITEHRGGFLIRLLEGLAT